MVTRLAWLLNLDAERELDDPRRYRLSPAIEARIELLRPRMSTLLHEHDDVLGLAPPRASARALPFCATPFALSRIARAGLVPPRAPPLSVLARVNSRAFSAELGQTLPTARYVRSLAALQQALDSAPPTTWLLKRDFGFAGRERRRVLGGVLDASSLGFARRSFARGQGLQVEPWLTRTEDVALHGYVFEDGAHLLGEPMRQECDAQGSWQSSRALLAHELAPPTQQALTREAVQVAEALALQGYFGPFGIDGYAYLEAGDEPRFQPRSEINARFSMGYPRGLLERALTVLL